MKKIILGLKNDYLIYIFVLFGLALIIFPTQVMTTTPYVIGSVLILYATANLIISIKYPDSKSVFGNSLVGLILGAAILFQRSDAIGTLGVIWAVRSLYESGEELTEMWKEKKVHIISLMWIAISAILAMMLILDPFEHFTMHIRILGLEILTSAFIRRRKLTISEG